MINSTQRPPCPWMNSTFEYLELIVFYFFDLMSTNVFKNQLSLTAYKGFKDDLEWLKIDVDSGRLLMNNGRYVHISNYDPQIGRDGITLIWVLGGLVCLVQKIDRFIFFKNALINYKRFSVKSLSCKTSHDFSIFFNNHLA